MKNCTTLINFFGSVFTANTMRKNDCLGNTLQAGKNFHKQFLLMPLMVLVVLFGSGKSWGQNAFNSGDGWGSGWGTGAAFTASAGTSLIYTTTNTSGGSPTNRFFRFYGTGTPCGEYGPSGASDVLLSPATAYTSSTITCGSAKAFYLSVSNTTDNWVFKSASATAQRIIIFRVQGSIQSVSSVTQSPTVANGVAPGQAVTVTANLSGALATGQNVYLRYSTDNFSTSTIATFSGSGSTYTATIPAGTNTAGAAVKYYVFTSGATPSSADADFYTINLNNNSGSNYSYTVASQFYSKSTGNLESTSSWTTDAAGGTGTAPVDFAQAGVTYNIRNNATPTISANWAVSGSSSKVIVGDGTNACNFTVPGSLTVTSPATDVSSNGTITRTTSGANSWGTLTFVSNAKYVNNLSGGTLPTATWNANSTLQIDQSVTSDAAHFNQTFGNIVINGSSAFTFVPSTATFSTLSIAGSLTYNSSGLVFITNRTSTVTTNITGDLNVTGAGTLTGASGSGALTLNVSGKYNQTNGTFVYASNITNQTMTITGNLELSGGTFRIQASQGVTSSRNHKVVTNGNFIMSGGTFNFSDESNSLVPASAVFALLEVKGNFTQTAGTISETASDADVVTRITLTGTTGTQTLESTGQTGLIDFNVAASNAQCVISATKTFVLSSTATMTIANGTSAPDLLVDGTFSNFNAASPTVTGTITFSSTGTYEHNVAAGIVPAATWNATSTCTIKAQLGASPSGLGQNFGNFTWNCSTQTSTIQLGDNLGFLSGGGSVRSIQGNFTVLNTGASFPTTARYFRLYGTVSNPVFKIGGDLILSSNSGGFSFSNGSATNGALVIGGNFNMTAGGFEPDASTSMNMIFTGTGKTYTQSGGTIATTVSKLNYVIANGASLTQANDIGVSTGRSFILNGTLNTGASTIINGAGTFANQPVLSLSRTGNTTINTNAIASLSSATSVQVGMSITGSNIPAGTIITAISGTTIYISNVASTTATGVTLTISTTASTLGVASTAGIVTGTPATTGNIRTTTATFDAGANYIYNNSTPAAQVTGSALTSANNLEISNTSGVTLSASTAVAGTLTFTNGSLTLGANDLTLGASATVSGAGSTKYVITNSTGQLKRSSLTTAFTFPVGNSAYNPITLTNTGTSDTYGIIAKDGTVPNALDDTKAVNRYWAVTEGVAGSGNLAVTAQFNTADGAGASYNTATNPQYIGIYPNASPWTQVSSGAAASGSNPYTVSASGFTNTLPTSGSTYYFAVGISGAFNVPAPTITASGGVVASSPGATTSGYVGNTITINGTGLGSVTVVKVGGSAGTSVTIVSQSATSLTFAAINLGGTIYVENPGGNATSSESYTNLGYITTQTGGWSTAATWLGNAVPTSATTTNVTIAHDVTSTTGTTNVGKLTVNASTTLTITASTTVNINTASTNSGTITNNGTLSTAVTYTNSGTMNINGTFQLNTGSWATGTNFVYGAAGTLNFNASSSYSVSNTDVFWPTSNGPFNVSVLQGGLTLSSANRTVAGTFATAAGVTQTSSTLTISGTNQLNSGGFFNSAPSYSGSATLIYNNTGTYAISNEWTGNAATAGSGVPFNVTIQNGTTLTFPTSNRGIGGNFNVASGGATLNATSGDLYVAGNFTNNGTFTHNTRALFLNGTTQTLGGSNINGSGATNCFPYLILQNGTNVTLGASAAVTNTLTLTSGKITLSTFDLNMGAAAISSASSSNYIVTNSTGQLKRTVANSAVSFPVGNSAYNPITFTNAGTSDTYGIRVADGAPTNANDANTTVQRSWYITEAMAGGSDLTSVIPQYNSGEEGANFNAGTTPYLGLYNSTLWTQVPTTLAGTNPYTATSSGSAQFLPTIPADSYIAIGKDGGLASATPSISSFTLSGYSGSSVVISGANFTGATAVSFGGTSAASYTVDNEGQITAVVGTGGASGSVSVTTPSGLTSLAGFTYLGFITKTGATNWNNGASWLGDAIPTANTAVTIAHNLSIAAAFTNSPISSITVNTGVTATASATVAIGTVTNAITTVGTGVFTFSGAGGSIIAGSFVNGGTLSWSAAATLNISAVGTLTNNGTFTRGTGTVNFVGLVSTNSTIDGSTAITFNNLTSNSGQLLFTTLPTIDGTFQLNGGYVSAAPIYTSNSTLYYNLSYNRSTEWSATGVGTIGTTAGYPNNVTINTGTFDIVNGSSTARAMNGTLTVNTGATFNVNGLNAAVTIGGGLTTNGTGSFNMGSTSAAVTVAGAVTNAGSLTLSSTSGGDIYVAGNFTNNGTFTHNSRAVFLNGTAQTISGSALNASGTTNCFDYLFLQNGTNATLGASVSVRSGITFTSGKITLSTYDLNAGTATITTPTSSSYVVTNSTGQLKKTVGASAVLFPVGNTAYNPITLNNSGTSDSYGVVVVEGALTSNDQTYAVNRRWQVTESVSGNSNLAVTAQYNTGEQSSNYNSGTTDYLGFYNGSSWIQQAATRSGSNPFTIASNSNFALTTANLTTGTQYFAIGRDIAFFPPAPVVTSVDITSAYSGSTVVITGTNFTGATAVSFGGTAAASYTVNSATQITAVVGTGGTSGSVSVTTPSGSGSLAGFTYSGFITTSGATNWNTASSWLGGAVPTANNAVTIAHNLSIAAAFTNSPIASITVNTGITATASATVAIGTVTGSITTVGSGVFTLTGASGSIIAGSFVNGGTLSWGAAATLNISAGGTLTNNGTFTRGTGSVVFANAGTVNGSSAITFNNLTLTSGVLSLTTTPTIDGIFALNGGNISTNAPFYTNTSTLQYGATYSRFLEWSASGVGTIGTTAGYPNNVTISTGTFTVLNSDAGIPRAMAGNLSVSTGCTFTTGALNAVLTIGGNLTTTGTGNFNMSSSNAAVTVVGSVSNAGTLALSSTSGGDLNVAGNWTNTGTFTPNSRAVTFNGTAAQTINATATFDYLTIANTTANVTAAAGITINSAKTLTINSSARLDMGTNTLTLTGATSSVAGFLRSAGTITGASISTLTIANGGTYEHNFTTAIAAIPTATWSSGSTCSVIGYTSVTSSSVQTGLGQTFHHFTWNTPSWSTTSGNINFGGALTTVNGNLNISSTNSKELRFATLTSYTLAVGGDFSLGSNANVTAHYSNNTGTFAGVINVTGSLTQAAGGTLKLAHSSNVNVNYPSTVTITVSKNVSLAGTVVLSTSNGAGTINQNGAAPTFGFSQTAGSIDFGQTTGTAGVGGINVKGTYSLTGTGAMITSGSAATNGLITLNGGASQTITNSTSGSIQKVNWNIANGSTTTLSTAHAINTAGTSTFTVANGGILDFSDKVLSGAATSTFVASTGSTLISANTSGTGAFQTSTANGSVQTTTRTFTATGVDYTFNGASAQYTGDAISAASNVNNITINNSEGVSLSAGTTVSGILTHTSGKLTIGTNTLTLNGTVSGMSASNSLVGSSTSNLTIGGTGALGTLFFDQTTPGTTNALSSLSINKTAGSGTPGATLGSALNVTTTLALTSTSTLTLGDNLTVSASGNNSVAGILAGTGNLIKTGAGTLTLSAASGNNTAHTYSGGTTVSGSGTGTISVTGLTNITSASITSAAQSVTFSSSSPTNGTYQLLPGALTVGTQSFTHNAGPTKSVSLDYTNSTVTVASASISTSTISQTTYCAGGTLSVAFTTNAAVSGTYTAQLSNASGSFASPVTLGTNTTSPISATIPAGTSTGTGYRIRVVNTGNSITGSDNGGNITVNYTAAPTASAQSFCSATSPTVASLVATGTAIKWYDASSNGNLLASGTALSAGTYYASQTVASCESTRTSVVATINTNPSAPTASAQSFCSATSPTVASLVATGTAIQWYDAATNGNLLASGTALSAGTYYASQTVDGCESTTRSVSTVSLINSGTWLGGNGSWNNAANWCGGIPTASTNVVISNGNPILDVNHTLGSGSTLTLSGTSTLTINPNAILTIAGTADFGGKSVTLKSDSSGTAAIGQVTGTLSNATNVTVERYIPAKRAWRALTAPLKGSDTSLYASWQNGGATPVSPFNTGVELWGPSGTGLATGPGYNIRQYTTSGWADITNTQSTNLFATDSNKAYLVFVTGGYGSNNIGNGQSAATTLKATGELITGTVNFPVTSARHTLVGNPFASPLSPAAIMAGNTQDNLYTNIWMWDPAISTNGAYVNYTASINSGTFSDVSGSYSSSTTAIQSGQAFFVRAVANTDTLTLTESMKSSSISNTFRNSNSIAASVFRLGFAKQIGTEWMPLDGCIAAFYDAANAAVDVADGTKMVNTYENIAFVRGTTNLSIEHYPLVNATDQLNVKIWNTQQAHYKLKLNTEEFTMVGVEAWLQDLYTGTSQSLNLDGSVQDYEFDVDPTVSASSGNRFRIVFTNTALAVDTPTQGQLSIYPNPATGGKVTVSLPTGTFEGCSYELINVLGQVVRQDEITNSNSSQVLIPLTGLPNSWYALRIMKDKNVMYQGKLIIKN